MNTRDHLFSYTPKDGEVRYRQAGNSVAIQKEKEGGGGRIGLPLYNGVRIWTQPPYFVF